MAVLALVVPLLVASPASADNVTYPGQYTTSYGGDMPINDDTFSAPVAPAGNFLSVSSGDTIGAWAVGGGGVNLNSSSYLPVPSGAPAGSQDIDLQGNQSGVAGEGSLSQTVTTVPGQLYTLGFFLAGNVYGGPTVKTGTVSIGGQVHSFSFDDTGDSSASAADMGWAHESYTFTATSTSTPIVFASTTAGGSGSYGPVITGVFFATLAQTEIPIPTIAPGATGTLHLDIATSSNWESDTNLPSGVTFVNANSNTLVSPTEVTAGPFPSAPPPDHLDLPIKVSPSATPGTTLTATVPSSVQMVDANGNPVGSLADIHIQVIVGSNNPVPLVNLRVVGGLAGIVVVILGGLYVNRRRHAARVA